MISLRLALARSDFTLDVNLQLPATGVSALFGPSGCGKTTLLRALAGLERAAGRVALGGDIWQDDAAGIWLPTHRRPLGYVIQEAALFPHLTVRDNLAYGQRRGGPAVAGFSLPAVVDLLGIGPLMQRKPATLSGGERQRVAIARALASAPQLLLMDEPLAALDAERKADVLPYLERLHHELKLPLIYVSHSMDEVARLADHLVLLRAGKVLAAGPLAELLARPDLPLARGDDAGVVIDAEVAGHDTDYGLTRLQLAGTTLWVGATRTAPGERVRVRVLARDVSVSRKPPAETSVLNVLPVRLRDVHIDGQTALLSLAIEPADGSRGGEGATGGTLLLARITRRSQEALALQPGDALFAQIKGVALM